VHLDSKTIQVGSGELVDVPARLQASPDNLKARSTPVSFTVTAEDNPKYKVEEPARFLGPATGG
jgi:hypothetical protein